MEGDKVRRCLWCDGSIDRYNEAPLCHDCYGQGHVRGHARVSSGRETA